MCILLTKFYLFKHLFLSIIPGNYDNNRPTSDEFNHPSHIEAQGGYKETTSQFQTC